MAAKNILKNIAKVFILLFFLAGVLSIFVCARASSMERSRATQKRSQADVRSLAVAVLSYWVDWDSYPDTGGRAIPFQEIDSLPGTKSKIVPDYLREFIAKDGWGKGPYYYNSNGKNFVIYCLGSDGKAGRELEGIVTAVLSGRVQEYKPTSCYEDDIVWGDDAFIRAPEGKQKRCK